MNNILGRLGMTLAVVFFSGFVSAPALADDNFGVARISLLNGTVTMQRGDSRDTVAAAVNAPLMVGDYLSTATNSRAEVQFDNANFVRIGSGTQIRFTKLDPTDHTVQLAEGTIAIRILRQTDARPQVDTPSITIRPDDPGSYRITVTSSGDTLFTVRSGRADLLAPQRTQTIGSGVSVLVSGSSSNPQIHSADTVAYDDFDAWNSQRDQYAEHTLSEQYASSGVVGLDDLDRYGHWIDTPEYGDVWVPDDEDANWAPYHDGRWVWEPYCGWTWVGYEPWGWAPYHYGRWFYAPSYGWAWYPGPRYIYPVWQPAFVAFFGFGNGFSLSLAFGNIGWVPLAPYEPFYPWWGNALAFSTTNITNITYNITNINNYQNAGKPGGVGIITRHMLEAGSVYRYLQVRHADLDKVALARGPLPVVPTRENLRFNDQSPRQVALSPRFHNLAEPKLPPSFEQQRHTLQTVSQRLSPVQSEPRRMGTTLIARAHSVAPVNSTQHSVSAASGAAPGLGKQAAGVAASTETSAWSRFATARGLSPIEISHRAVLQAKPIPSSGAQITRITQTETTGVWSRFESHRGSTLHTTNEILPRSSSLRSTTTHESRGQFGTPSQASPISRKDGSVVHNEQSGSWERFQSTRTFPTSTQRGYSNYSASERAYYNSYPSSQRSYYEPRAPSGSMSSHATFSYPATRTQTNTNSARSAHDDRHNHGK